MGHRWESGFVTRKPAWHGLATVLEEWPGSWVQARKLAGLDWDVETEPVYSGHGADPVRCRIPGWQAIVRNDKDLLDEARVLSVQQDSYAVISTTELGAIVEFVLDSEDYSIKIESAGSLYGGRMIFVTTYFDEPLNIPGDPSETYSFVSFLSRHDGNGGLRAFPTNIRTECWNTATYSEMVADRDQLGVSIRHTFNWAERTHEMRNVVRAARDSAKHWEDLANALTKVALSRPRRETFLKRFIPIADDMTLLMQTHRRESRQQVRSFLGSPSCAGINTTLYGMLMAATEYLDHGRPYRSPDSYAARSLFRTEPDKKRAISVVKSMAGIR